MSNSFPFLSYYLYGLSVSVFILFESEIHKLSFQPSFALSDIFPDTQSCLLISLHKVILQCRPQTSWMLVVTSSLHLSVHPRVCGTGMCSRQIVCATTSTLNVLLSPPATRAPWFGNLCTMPCIIHTSLVRCTPPMCISRFRHSVPYCLLRDEERISGVSS